MENDKNNIKIHILHCGTIRLSEKQTYLSKSMSNKRVELPASVYFVEHPVHGNILIDTGLSSDCREIFPPHLNWFYDPHISKGQTAAEQLAVMGFKPEDIDYVILTHNDADHTCALRDFIGKAKHIIMPELEYFYSCRYVYRVRQAWKTYMPYKNIIEKPFFRGTNYSPRRRGIDIFGDDSFLGIFSPGHTEGHMMVVINKAPSNRFKASGSGNYGGPFVILAGDAAITLKNIDDLVPPGFGFDQGSMLQVLRWLKEQKADPNCKAVFCSHDPNVKPQTIVI